MLKEIEGDLLGRRIVFMDWKTHHGRDANCPQTDTQTHCPLTS